MNLCNRLTTLTLTSISLVVGFLPLSSTPAQAQDDVYIDRDCRHVPNSVIQNLSDPPWFHYQNIFYSRKFTANGKPYWLYVARYTDGAAMFCVSKPDFKQARLISTSEISGQFIEKVEQNSNQSSMFIVRVIQGQNTGAPFVDYRLDLSNPDRPVITFVRGGCCVDFD